MSHRRGDFCNICFGKEGRDILSRVGSKVETGIFVLGAETATAAPVWLPHPVFIAGHGLSCSPGQQEHRPEAAEGADASSVACAVARHICGNAPAVPFPTVKKERESSTTRKIRETKWIETRFDGMANIL